MLKCSDNKFNSILETQNWLEHRVYNKNPKNLKNHLFNLYQIDQLIITQDRKQFIMIKLINPSCQFHRLNLIWTKSPIWVVSSPRNFNFSQFTKLIKLIHQEQFDIVSQQKPIDQLWKKRFKTSKSPNILRFEIFPKMHDLMHE